MTIRSNLEGKKFRDMPSFIDALERGVREEITPLIQPFESRIAELEGIVASLQGELSALSGTVSGLSGQIDEIGSRQPPPAGGTGEGGGGTGGTGGGTTGGTGDGTTGGGTGGGTTGGTGGTGGGTTGGTGGGTTGGGTGGGTSGGGTTGGGTGAEKKYVSVNLPFFLTFQLPDQPVNLFGNSVPIQGEVITPATLTIQGTDRQPDGVFTKYAVGSSVTVSVNNIDSRVRFTGWELNGTRSSAATTYTFTVPDQDINEVTPTFVAANAATPAPSPTPTTTPQPQTITVTASWNVIGLGLAPASKSVTIESSTGQSITQSRASGQSVTLQVPRDASVTVRVSPIAPGEQNTWTGPSSGTSTRDSFTFTATQNATVRANILLPL